MKVSSLQDLFNVIAKYNVEGDRWFRGHNDTNFLLQPSAYRDLYTIKDRYDRPLNPQRVTYYHTHGDSVFLPDGLYLKTFFKFLDKKNIAYDQNMDIVMKFCLAQHYGVRTPLLDWSTDATVALFFAIDGRKDTDAALFILNPKQLNERTILQGEIIQTSDVVKLVDDLPVAFHAPKKDKRMCRQSGNFTAHGTNIWPLDYYHPAGEYLVKIIIPSNVCQQIENWLRSFGIDHDSIYVENDIKDKVAKEAQVETEKAVQERLRQFTKEWEDSSEKGNPRHIVDEFELQNLL